MQPRPDLLTPRQVEAFRHVVMARGVSAGARIMNISQPAVSRLIREMEQAVGMELFIRRGPRISPTEAALELFMEIEKVYLGLEHIRDQARRIRRFPRGQFRIASMLVLSQGFLAEVARTFSEAEPGLSLSIHSDASVDIIDQLKRGRHHVGLCTAIGKVAPYLVETSLPALPAVCIVPDGHALADRRVVGPADLVGEDFIALGRTSLLRKEITRTFAEAGVEPVVRHETLYSSTALALVRAGLGVSIVDPFSLIGNHGGGVVARPFEPAIPYKFSILVPEIYAEMREVAGFREALLKHFRILSRQSGTPR